MYIAVQFPTTKEIQVISPNTFTWAWNFINKEVTRTEKVTWHQAAIS